MIPEINERGKNKSPKENMEMHVSLVELFSFKFWFTM